MIVDCPLKLYTVSQVYTQHVTLVNLKDDREKLLSNLKDKENKNAEFICAIAANQERYSNYVGKAQGEIIDEQEERMDLVMIQYSLCHR